MKMKMPKIHNSGWKRRISLVLVFTMLLSTFMHRGLYSPQDANAAVANATQWAMLGSSATTIGTLPAMSLAKGAGTNRLLVVTVVGDYGAAITTFQPTVTYGGQTLTRINSTDTSSRMKVWIGYLNEAGIAAATGAPPAFAVSGVAPDTGCALSAAFYNGVDQTTPITGSRSVASDTAATTPTSGAINVTNGGWAIYASMVNTAIASTPPATYTEHFDTALSGSVSEQAVGSKAIAATGTENPLPTWTSVRYGFVSASLNPAPTGDSVNVGDGSDPANYTVSKGSSNNAADSFTMATNANTASVTAVTASVTNSTNVSGINLYADNGTVGTFDSGVDVLLATGTPGASVTFTPGAAEAISTTAKNYLIVADIAAGATSGATIDVSVTGVTVAAPDSQGTISDAANPTRLTVSTTLPSTITSCAGCHGYTSAFPDGTARNTPEGAFPGSHDRHVTSYTCDMCHVTPATESSSDHAHRTGTIQMKAGATAINGGYYDKNNSSSYNAGTDDSFNQSNAPALASCRNVSCHTTGIAGATMSAPTWGSGPANCTWCHGDPPTTSPLYNHSGVSAGVCASCHGHDGAGATHADGTLDGTFTCVGCHTSVQGTRAAVVGEFGMAWGHKKSGRAAVADADCIVCHLEGVFATQSRSATYHANGNIDLRDPDGAGETPITNNSGGAFTFAQYAVSYAAGSRTTTLGNTVAEVVTVKFCMKCHDGNGAINTTARSNNGGTGTAFMPFGGVNMGANYTTTNGAAAAGGVIDVAKQFLSTNSSRHPVGAPNNRVFPYSTRLLAPYNGLGTARNSNLTTGTAATPRTKANSVIMVCDDCHTTGTALTTRTITAHGSASQIRGTFFVSAATLCTTCHIGTYNDTTNGRHNAGSAFAVGTTRASSAMNQCHFCHFSQNEPYAAASRPRYAQDVHGFNELQGTSAGWTAGTANGMRPIAFMRSWATSGGSWPTTASPRPYTATLAGPGQFNLAAGQPQCGGTFAFNTTGTSPAMSCTSNGHTNYSPGGSY